MAAVIFIAVTVVVKMKREGRDSIEDKKGIKWKHECRKYKRGRKREMKKKSGKKKTNKQMQRHKMESKNFVEQTASYFD
jgi:hypothetical protein